MLKRMRWRLILAAMLAFFTVISLIAVLVNVVNHLEVTRSLDRTLSYISEYEARTPDDPKVDAPPMEPFLALPDLEANYMTRFFVVRFDEADRAVSTSMDYIASVDREKAVQYANQALEKKSDRGYINDYRFTKRTVDGATVVIFLNAARELQSMRSLRMLTIAISCGSLLLVFLLVLLFSGRAIRPIANNIRRQKQFITDASHELKTPLTSISASADVLSLEYGEDEWVDNIQKQTSRMTKLVSELVTLSRLDEDTPLPNKEHFSLSNAAWEIAEVYQPQAKAQGKTFTADIQDGISLFGEKTAVQQMFSVLLDNAIRYSDQNGNIRFSMHKKRNKVRIEVFNTCRYDVPPDVSRLFDRFYRPDGSRSSETGGTGIGLAIAKAVAETHGGAISASCPKGDTMTITVVL